MDHRIVGRAVFAFALAASVPSLPATTISFNFGGQSCGSAGSCTAVPGATTISFDSLTVSTPSPYTQGLLTYTWTGSQSPFVQGSVSGQYAAPVGDTTTFLTIGTANKPATVTLSFSKPVYYFGFYMGSPDSYNSISFYDNTTLIRSFTGDQLMEQVAAEGLALYEADLAALRRSVDRSILAASPVDRVVRAVVHALVAKRPKTRYFLGWPVRLSFKGMRMLPDWLRDWIVRKQLGLR